MEVTTKRQRAGSAPCAPRNAAATRRTASGRILTPTPRPGSGAIHASTPPAAASASPIATTRRTGGVTIGAAATGATAGGTGGAGSAALSAAGSSTKPPRLHAAISVAASGTSSAPTPASAVTTK